MFAVTVTVFPIPLLPQILSQGGRFPFNVSQRGHFGAIGTI